MLKNITAIGGVALFIAGVAAAADKATTTTSTTTTPQAVTVVAAPAATAKAAATTPVTAAATAAKATAVPVASVPTTITTPSVLKPLDLTDMKIWNWGGKWLASEWDNANSTIPWRYNHITQPARADTTFKLDASGAPQLQALNGTPAYVNGMWETEVTLPKMRDGVIVAPLWIYDATSKDEVDFEFAGRNGLDLTLHAVVAGVARQSTTRLFAGTDMSGQRKRFGIRVDQTAGYVDMYVDNKFVYRFDRTKVGFFVSHSMKPFIEMAAFKPTNIGFVQWAGKWTGFATGESMTMTVHGYGYTALAK